MKGKRYTTEEKVRVLREADRGERSIMEICREENTSDVTFRQRSRNSGYTEGKQGARMSEAGMTSARRSPAPSKTS